MEKVLQRLKEELNAEIDVEEFFDKFNFDVGYKLIVNGKKSRVVLNSEIIHSIENDIIVDNNINLGDELFSLIKEQLKNDKLI